MGLLNVTKTIRINRSADDVWAILSDGYTTVGNWATAVAASRPNPDAGDPIDGAPVAGRVCSAPGFGDINEKIVDYDASMHTLTYEATASKIPGFVKDLRNRWDVRPVNADACEVTTVLTADATGVMGAVMGPMMKRKFGTTIETTVQDLKTFAETGSPSASKQKALAQVS